MKIQTIARDIASGEARIDGTFWDWDAQKYRTLTPHERAQVERAIRRRDKQRAYFVAQMDRYDREAERKEREARQQQAAQRAEQARAAITRIAAVTR